MKLTHGILLSGGEGTRLRPLTKFYNKGLVPIHDKFIIDYPVKTMADMGIKHLTVILGGSHFSQIVSYLQDGSQFGLKINYIYQDSPRGISQAINLAQPYVENEEVFAVILGDNVYTKPIVWQHETSLYYPFAAHVLLHKHPELKRFGVMSIDDKGKIIKIAEKPEVIDETVNNYAITGCYLFNRDFFQYFAQTKPSARGEFEITDIIQKYLENDDLQYSFVEGDWLDTGTFESIEKVRLLVK